MEIYWIKDKQRCGPAPVPDVMDRIRLGELAPDTLGWHSGVKGWKPLRELPALADLLQEGAPPAPAEETPGLQPEPCAPAAIPDGLPPKPGADSDGEVHLGINVPARLAAEIGETPAAIPSVFSRLLARGIDTLLYLALALGALYLSGAPYNQYYLPGSPLFWLPMLLAEAFCLGKWNTTPGKRLMGIYICALGKNARLTFARAFMRAFMVYILGLGMLSFPFFPIMPLVAYWVLRKQGISWWDTRVFTLPIAKAARFGIMRVVLPLVILYLCLVAAGIFMKPWYKPMYEELYKADPDTARFMLRWIPELQNQIPQDRPAPQPLGGQAPLP